MFKSCSITSPVVLVLLDDLIVGLGAAVTTASLVVLATLLARYRVLVRDASKSTDLAKNLWDAMNARLITQDTRIVDLMAKVEVYSIKNRGSLPSPSTARPAARDAAKGTSRVDQQTSQSISQLSSPFGQPERKSEETEMEILRVLIDGPKTSNQIRQVIGRSREHTGRLMKALFGRGLVVRNDRRKPYVYEVTEAGRRYLSGS
jgi:predicted transcriptional regulator